MTDFLKRVSEMALGLTPAIRPLVVARYAPGPQLPVPEITVTEDHPWTNASSPQTMSNSLLHRLEDPEHGETIETTAPQTKGVGLPTTKPQTIAGPPEDSLTEPPPFITTPASFMDENQPHYQSQIESASRFHIAHNARDDDITSPLNAGAEVFEPQTSRPSEKKLRNSDTGDLSRPAPPDVIRVEEHETFLSQPAVDVTRPERKLNNQEGDQHSIRDTLAPSATADRGQAMADSRDETFEVDRSVPRPHENDRSELPGSVFSPQPTHSRENDPGRAVSARATPLQRGPDLPSAAASPRADSDLFSSREERTRNVDEPVIRVTIGRIEVRAVTTQPPLVESSTPPAPKLSLDEYLRQHKNGRPR